MIKGNGVWDAFKNEGGKHVVQRVPPNDRRGRVHTSTVSVSVIPLVPPEKFNLNWNDVETSVQNGSGPGGQSRNRTMSCVQMKHRPTGTIVRIDTEKSQHQNRAIAAEILEARLQALEDDRHQSDQSKARVEQMGRGTRSGKIRTYSFNNGIVIDHRLGRTSKDLKGVMKGRLDSLIR